MAHITGGGITDNLPRVLPAGTHARDRSRSSWRTPAIFEWLQRAGDVPDADMLRTFNMGIGLILACSPDRERELHRRRWLAPASRTPCASARFAPAAKASCLMR